MLMPWLCLLMSLGAEPQVASPVKLSGVVMTLIDEADVPAREAGVLTRIAAREGETVEEGQLLGQIDDQDVQLLLSRAETELEQAVQKAENDIKIRFARKSAEVAQAELQRAIDAVAKFNKSVSQTEIDRLQLLAEKSNLEVEQATIEIAEAALTRKLKERDVDLARLKVDRRRITAPLTGMVVRWQQHPGEWVEPGAPVVRIIRLNKLRAEGFARSTDLPLSLIGSTVRLHLSAADGHTKQFEGELTFISPEIDPVNGQVRFWAEIENPKLELRPGQIGTLEVPGRSR